MVDDVDKEIRQLLSRIISNNSVAMTIRTGGSDIRHGKPSYFIHYEFDPDEKIRPVEHDEASTIPLTCSSVVASVWENGDEEYVVYKDRMAFENEFR